MTKIVANTIKAMSHVGSSYELNQLDAAAEILFTNDVISGDEYDEIHHYYRTHWFNEKSGQVEILD